MRSSIVMPISYEGDSVLHLLHDLLAQISIQDSIYAVLTGTCENYSALTTLAKANPALHLCQGPGAFPGEARNIGIAAAHDATFIVQIDAGCFVAPNWLNNMLEPLISDTCDYVVGAIHPYRSATELWGVALDREALFAALTQQRMRRQGDMPGGAAIAYRRNLWEAAGGYPANLRCGEDKLFAERVATLGPRVLFVETAVAYWELGPQAGNMLCREYRYSMHDALLPQVSMAVRIKLGECIALTLMLLFSLIWPSCLWLFVIPLAYLSANTAKKVRRYESIAQDKWRKLSATGCILVVILNFTVLYTRLLGTARGLAQRMVKGASYV